MTRNGRWFLLLAAILLMNAVFILLGARGRIEGYVSSAICAIVGILIAVLGIRTRAGRKEPGDESRRRGSAE